MASGLHLPSFLCGEACPVPSAQDWDLWSSSRPPSMTEFIPSSALLLPLQGQWGSSEGHTAFKQQRQTWDVSRSDGSLLPSEILLYFSLSLDVTKSYLPCHVLPSPIMTEPGCFPKQLKPRCAFSPCLREASPHYLLAWKSSHISLSHPVI